LSTVFTMASNGAASSSSASSKKKIQNFDLVVDELQKQYYAQLPAKTTSAKGHATNAYKELKSSFSESRKSTIKSSNATTAASTPQPQPTTPAHNTRSSSTITPNPPTPARLECPSDDDYDPINPPRLDICPIAMSSTNQGMQRLRLREILRLHDGQQFTLVVPPTDRKQTAQAIKQRKHVLIPREGITLLQRVQAKVPLHPLCFCNDCINKILQCACVNALIANGFLWPSIEHTIVSMPGCHPRPHLTYQSGSCSVSRSKLVKASIRNAFRIIPSSPVNDSQQVPSHVPSF